MLEFSCQICLYCSGKGTALHKIMNDEMRTQVLDEYQASVKSAAIAGWQQMQLLRFRSHSTD